ncbi:MAG: helix-turn-helix domain-containing protein [Dehalococcoidia bacterium]
MVTLNDGKLGLMTTPELAEYLRISRASVYRLVRQRQIPVSKVGRQLRFRKDIVDVWLSKTEAS